ncbi:hypothetical protein AB0L40_21175 [Patulibacter sp. NPDC049589]|uniref:hypothetical protein n=1 Tax=Patulibacter sp. NPDC049589 TaxID=3154731 RepID=UPI0034240FAC
MTSSRRPARRLLRRLAACAPLLLAPVLLPAAASADDTQANTWSGGSLDAARGAGSRAIYPRRGALVSLITGAPKARMNVTFEDPRCGVSVAIPAARSAIAPGGQGFYQAVTAHGRKTRRYASRYGTTKLTATVDLAPSSPGVLAGTLQVDGVARDTRRPITCRISVPVVVRSHQSLLAPLAPGPIGPSSPRTGLVDVTIGARVPGSIAITRRADGRSQAIWTFRYRCRVGSRRITSDGYETSKRFAVRSNGSFRGVERRTLRGRYRGHAYVFRYSGVLSGRIGSDGIARGRVRDTTTRVFPDGKYLTERCDTGSRRFVAAP